jgi:hypothetical protein
MPALRHRVSTRVEVHTALAHAQPHPRTPLCQQIFSLELGNVAALEEAVVEVSYLRVLEAVGGALEYVHTATWTPPYLGSAGDAARGPAAAEAANPRFAAKVILSCASTLLAQ